MNLNETITIWISVFNIDKIGGSFSSRSVDQFGREIIEHNLSITNILRIAAKNGDRGMLKFLNDHFA